MRDFDESNLRVHRRRKLRSNRNSTPYARPLKSTKQENTSPEEQKGFFGTIRGYVAYTFGALPWIGGMFYKRNEENSNPVVDETGHDDESYESDESSDMDAYTVLDGDIQPQDLPEFSFQSKGILNDKVKTSDISSEGIREQHYNESSEINRFTFQGEELDVRSITLRQLKEHLSSVGLSTSGKKSDLFTRLRKYVQEKDSKKIVNVSSKLNPMEEEKQFCNEDNSSIRDSPSQPFVFSFPTKKDPEVGDTNNSGSPLLSKTSGPDSKIKSLRIQNNEASNKRTRVNQADGSFGNSGDIYEALSKGRKISKEEYNVFSNQLRDLVHDTQDSFLNNPDSSKEKVDKVKSMLGRLGGNDKTVAPNFFTSSFEDTAYSDPFVQETKSYANNRFGYSDSYVPGSLSSESTFTKAGRNGDLDMDMELSTDVGRGNREQSGTGSKRRYRSSMESTMLHRRTPLSRRHSRLSVGEKMYSVNAERQHSSRRPRPSRLLSSSGSTLGESSSGQTIESKYARATSTVAKRILDTLGEMSTPLQDVRSKPAPSPALAWAKYGVMQKHHHEVVENKEPSILLESIPSATLPEIPEKRSPEKKDEKKPTVEPKSSDLGSTKAPFSSIGFKPPGTPKIDNSPPPPTPNKKSQTPPPCADSSSQFLFTPPAKGNSGSVPDTGNLRYVFSPPAVKGRVPPIKTFSESQPSRNAIVGDITISSQPISKSHKPFSFMTPTNTSESIPKDQNVNEKPSNTSNPLLKFCQQDTGKWKCPSCMVKNDDSVSKCPCCETDRPGGQSGSTISSKNLNRQPPKLGSANSGFTFGVDTEKSSSDTNTKGFSFGSSGSSDEKTAAKPGTFGGFTFGVPSDSNAENTKKDLSFAIPSFIDSTSSDKEKQGQVGSVEKSGCGSAAPSTIGTSFKTEESSGSSTFTFGNASAKDINPNSGTSSTTEKLDTPSFSFGIKPTAEKNESTAVSFGIASKSEAPNAPSLSFGSNSETKQANTTSFKFGDASNSEKKNVPSFTFGDSSKSKPSFTFGASSSADNSKEALGIGQKAEASPVSTGTGFSFESTITKDKGDNSGSMVANTLEAPDESATKRSKPMTEKKDDVFRSSALSSTQTTSKGFTFGSNSNTKPEFGVGKEINTDCSAASTGFSFTEKSKEVPSFTFGSTNTTASNDTTNSSTTGLQTNAHTTQNKFGLGSSMTGHSETQSTPKFTFGVSATPKETPAAPTPTPAPTPAPAFSFGATASSTNNPSTSNPGFSFNATKSTPSTNSSFSFGGSSNATNLSNGNTPKPFTFGASTTPVVSSNNSNMQNANGVQNPTSFAFNNSSATVSNGTSFNTNSGSAMDTAMDTASTAQPPSNANFQFGNTTSSTPFGFGSSQPPSQLQNSQQPFGFGAQQVQNSGFASQPQSGMQFNAGPPAPVAGGFSIGAPPQKTKRRIVKARKPRRK